MNELCDFDTSFHRYRKSLNHWSQRLSNSEILSIYNSIKEHYKKNINRESKIHGNIPRIFHQIWLGDPMPDILIHLVEELKKISGWDYKLWGDKEILTLNFENKKLYSQAKNYGEKSDIARLAILQEFGGVYLDTDFAIIDINRMEQFCNYYDFIIGFEPINHSLKLGNAFIASSKNHPCIQKMNQRLKSSFFDTTNCDNFKSNTISKTGPGFVSRIIYENLKFIKGGILLPPTYLYPFPCNKDEELEFLSNPAEYIKPETIGIHYWTQLWSDKKHPYIKFPELPIKNN